MVKTLQSKIGCSDTETTERRESPKPNSRFARYMSAIWPRGDPPKLCEEQLYAFTGDIYPAIDGRTQALPVTAFAIYDPSTNHDWMSLDYLEHKLKIPITRCLPVIRGGTDEELKPAVGRIHLSWRCAGLSPYKQLATFYIAPDGNFDVLFGQNTQSLQKGKFSWDTAISRGAMKTFKSKQEGESLIRKSDHESAEFKRQSSGLSFEQGIRKGILVPVNANVGDAEEAALRPSLAELENFFYSEGATTNISEETASNTNEASSQQTPSIEIDHRHQSHRPIQASNPDSTRPAIATQINVEKWAERCGGCQGPREEPLPDSCRLEGSTTGAAMENGNSGRQSIPASYVEKEVVKSRRPSEAEESTNKRRRSVLVENVIFDTSNDHDPGTSLLAVETTNKQEQQTHHFKQPSLVSYSADHHVGDSAFATPKSVPRKPVKDLSVNPQRHRRQASRGSRPDRCSDTRSSRRDSSVFREASPVDQTEIHYSIPNYRYDEPSSLQTLDSSDFKMPTSSDTQWQLRPSGYTLEHALPDEALWSSGYPQSSVSKKESFPKVPRSHRFHRSISDDWPSDLHVTATGSPAVVMEAETEEKNHANIWE